VHERGRLNRADLTAGLGLARNTVGSLVSTLVDAGILSLEDPVPASGPGRPSPILVPASPGHCVIAVQLAARAFRVATVGLAGRLWMLDSIPLPASSPSPDDGIGSIAEVIDAQVRRLQEAGGRCVGICVAACGVVDQRNGIFDHGPNLGWRSVPLVRLLQGSLRSAPLPITIANDSQVGGLAEYRRGAARGAHTLLYIASKVGLGGSVLIEGRPIGNGYAGEMGHMLVNPTGQLCNCGNVGCWETEIDQRALLRHAGRRIDCDFNPDDEVDRILEAAAAGEEDARHAVDLVAFWLGDGLVSLINLLNPSIVVFGQWLAKLHPLVVDHLSAEVSRRALAPAAGRVPLVRGHLGDEAVLLGAAELAVTGLLQDPLGVGRSGLPPPPPADGERPAMPVAFP
jgi:predicted NBD/HSP70 family sugar kinase